MYFPKAHTPNTRILTQIRKFFYPCRLVFTCHAAGEIPRAATPCQGAARISPGVPTCVKSSNQHNIRSSLQVIPTQEYVCKYQRTGHDEFVSRVNVPPQWKNLCHVHLRQVGERVATRGACCSSSRWVPVNAFSCMQACRLLIREPCEELTRQSQSCFEDEIRYPSTITFSPTAHIPKPRPWSTDPRDGLDITP